MVEVSDPWVTLKQTQDFCFDIDFGGGIPTWIGDERPPLGGGRGPSPAQLLVAAVSNCMVDALYFAVRKFNLGLSGQLSAQGWAEIGRNDAGRMRVLELRVVLHLSQSANSHLHLDRILAQFEEFCTVGRSVAQGIPLQVTVVDSLGQVVKAPSR
ncbi:MAG: OsmC family protein [Ferrovum sp.]|nr:OsmC family protein [Ferrovum sp.]NDU87682.1 OsmC family protein [Ferrovum sp.]